jgi:hypothetical protein
MLKPQPLVIYMLNYYLTTINNKHKQWINGFFTLIVNKHLFVYVDSFKYKLIIINSCIGRS